MKENKGGKTYSIPGLLRSGSPVEKGARIIELKFGDQKMHYCHNIPVTVMRDLVLLFKSENLLAGIEVIGGCSPAESKDRSLHMIFINKLGSKNEDEWKEHKFFKDNVLHEHLFEGFESYLKESLCEIHDGENYVDGKLFEFHRTGIITTTSAMHQDLHCDDPLAYTIDGFDCFIYHLPLDPEGLHVRVAYLHESEDDVSVIELRLKMIHVPFGCMVLFPPKLIHSGHYGSPGSLRILHY